MSIPLYNKKVFFLFYPHTLTFRLNGLTIGYVWCEGKCEGKLSPLTLALTPKSVLNPICPVWEQSNGNQNINQTKIKKKNQKTNPCKRLRDKSVILRECFLI